MSAEKEPPPPLSPETTDGAAETTAVQRARALRKQQTEAEIKLWSLLRRGQIGGHQFHRQVPIGKFTADFACLQRHLIIEVDGGQHTWRQDQDTERTRQIEAEGFRILRFWSTDILQNPDGVLLRLHQAINETSDDHAETH